MTGARWHSAYGRRLSELSVLVVDDSKHMRLLLVSFLRAFGCANVFQARNGAEALDMIRPAMPDLVLLDWEMRPVNGESFLRELRDVENTPHCFMPVVVLTGHAEPKLIKAAFAGGASQLLVKPVKPQLLLERLQWVLQDDRPFERAGEIYRQPPIAKKSAAPSPAKDDFILID